MVDFLGLVARLLQGLIPSAFGYNKTRTEQVKAWSGSEQRNGEHGE